MSDLLQFVAKKDYSSFRKEYNQVFEQKFDELASEIEKDAIAELSLYPIVEAKRKMKKVKENEDEFELVSIEAPEDEKSIIIKYELDGEKGEKILDEEDDIEYYKEIVSDTDDLTDEQMNKIKSDCLESKKRK